MIGACGFTQLDRHPPEIGYWLGVKFWGKGYATEAVRAVIDHAFTDLDCEAIQSAARVTNPASRRVLEKCGFQWTGAGLLRIRAICKLGADRPLPPRPRPVGLAQELGQHAAGVIEVISLLVSVSDQAERRAKRPRVRVDSGTLMSKLRDEWQCGHLGLPS